MVGQSRVGTLQSLSGADVDLAEFGGRTGRRKTKIYHFFFKKKYWIKRTSRFLGTGPLVTL